MRWSDAVEGLELTVHCGGARHVVRWTAGAVNLDQHPDLDAELALVAFGGDEPPCVSAHRLWSDAVTDGGFLGEWADGEYDRARRWWLAMALERMRHEGFHEFLRDIPLARARRMGEFLTRFPDPWLDRAACQVADAALAGDPRLAALVRVAVSRRLRHAFVLAVGGRQVALGAAALVPLSVEFSPGPAAAVGRLDGRSSRVGLVVDDRWLARVWGAGAAVVGGDLVLSVDYASATPLARAVRWVPEGSGHVAELVESPLAFDPHRGWQWDRSAQ
jgi:hypothetical protein